MYIKNDMNMYHSNVLQPIYMIYFILASVFLPLGFDVLVFIIGRWNVQ